MRVLVVCTANICRSPYGAAALAHALADPARYSVDSGGLHAVPGQPADPWMVACAITRGYRDLATHRSQPVMAALATRSDLILCMERAHRDLLLRHYPRMTGRIHTFMDLPPRDVDDPTGRAAAEYQAASLRIDGAARDWAQRIRRIA